MIEKIHHIGVVVEDADEALRFFRDAMGLDVTADKTIEEQGVRGVLLAVGENEIELLQPTQSDTGVSRYLESKGQTIHHICFQTSNIIDELARLESIDIELIDKSPRSGLAGEIAFIHPNSANGVLVELAQVATDTHSSHEKGFDHLALTSADVEQAKIIWKKITTQDATNNISVENRGMLITQVPVSQCVLEILSPLDSSDIFSQRLDSEGEGMVSMVAIEVTDIVAEIGRFRGLGYQLPDATIGPLPDSMVTTISAEQCYGLAIQFIEFSR